VSPLDHLAPGTRWLGCSHEHWTELASTNDRALAWARAGAPHGAVVTADAQTAGRGRLGRTWRSPAEDDLYVSMVLRPGAGKNIGALGLAVGVGLRDGLSSWVPWAQLKWPNDILCAGRKLAGILCEARWDGGKPEIVAGFGINVGRREFPGELAESATSLARELASAPDRAVVLARALVTIERALDEFFAGGFAEIRDRYEPHCALRGQVVQVDLNDGTGTRTPARALGLDDDGALRVEPLAGGPPRRVESGDVWLAE
jgi:BirA family biotin operon repressor/biotin-[acetyl-CoA-carboxylase] ligase